MATVTGALTDFGIQPFPALQPRLIFTPSGPAVSDARLFATKPIIVPVASGSGIFSVDLQPTDGVRPAVHYKVTIEWLMPGVDGQPGYTPADFLQWEIFVPAAGGAIQDLINAPVNPLLFWVGETPPPVPTAGQLWLKPSTGDIKKWS
jgi:hypothetical protein